MHKFSSDIESEYRDDKFANEVRRLCDQEISQELNKLKSSFESLKDDKWKWLTEAGKGVTSLTGIPLAFSIFPGTPIPCIVAAAAGIYALDKYMESRKAKKQLQRNGVAFRFYAGMLASRLR